jgi:hypothetical protein
MRKGRWTWDDLVRRQTIEFSTGGSVSVSSVQDRNGFTLHVVEIRNGRLTFTVIPERGLDLGDIYLAGHKMSWDRSGHHLLHPDGVRLQDGGGTGWLEGFYGCVASIGPELFGTPGEGYTLHGTGSYSPTRMETVTIEAGDDGLALEGLVTVRGYGDNPVFEKRIRVFTRWRSASLLREETTKNLSEQAVTLDDGYHVQLSGPFLQDGGRYVLPIGVDAMLLRDSAPPEADPLLIPPLSSGPEPIRCYQYMPGAVRGLEHMPDIGDYLPHWNSGKGIAAEMVVSADHAAAGFVIRPLSCFPRSLIAKEIASGGYMFALEPCRTRPNRMSQKHTDGEAFILGPGQAETTQCLIGVSRDRALIRSLEQRIRESV